MTATTSRAKAALPRRHFLGRMAAWIAGGALLGHARPAASGTPLPEFIGEIRLFPVAFAPQGWALCNGQLLPINQNQALFSILGTTYGGDGQTNFALPDLRGRVPIHFGQGPSLSLRTIGSTGGAESHPLSLAEMAAHRHDLRASSVAGTVAVPSPSQVPARHAGQVPQWGASAPQTMAADVLSSVGGSQQHTNMQPYLVLSYCIGLQGAFPDP